MPLSPEIQYYIDQKMLTERGAQNLSFAQSIILCCKHIRTLVANGTITFTQALNLSHAQCLNLEYIGRHSSLFPNGTINYAQFMPISRFLYHSLDLEYIRALVVNGTITLTQALNLNLGHCNNLSEEYIRALLSNRVLTLTQATTLQSYQRYNLTREYIYALITDGIITIGDALELTPEMGRALENEETRQRLRNRNLNIRDIIGGRTQSLNNAQSTHTASVHKSASDSATRLLKRYTQKYSNESLILMTLKKTIHALPIDHAKNDVAKRCIDRLTKSDYTHKDQTSLISTRQLLVLSWLAIHDNKVRIGSLKNATLLFVEGLYEIQRGYNLSDTGEDKGGPDKPICAAGAFNKLIEKLVCVHPDVELKFITPQVAALKLPSVVKEEVKNYIAASKNFATPKEHEAFIQKIKQVEKEGVTPIWDDIKKNVAKQMWDLFHELYINENDERFTGLIDSAQYIELGPLWFQKELSQLPTYAEPSQSHTIQYNQTHENSAQFRRLSQSELNFPSINRELPPK